MQLSEGQIQNYRAKLNFHKSVEDYNKEIGKNLKKARKRTPLTQANVAEILFTTEREIGRIETGKVTCSLEQLNQFRLLYDCKMDEILPNDMIKGLSNLHAADMAEVKNMYDKLGSLLRVIA